MPDREKVIKGLECLAKTGRCLEDECVYFHGHSCLEVVQDAIDLLKEQEAVTPQSFDEWHKIERNHMELRVWRCGYCTTSLDITDNFCRNCGKKVDWKT